MGFIMFGRTSRYPDFAKSLEESCCNFLRCCSSRMSRYILFLRVLASFEVTAPDAITPSSLEIVSIPVMSRCAFSYTPTNKEYAVCESPASNPSEERKA